jgi:hypothetical protein
MDFGTSNTVVAACVEGQPAEIVDVGGARRLPSVVFVDGEQLVVGRVAEDMAGSRPESVLRAPKNRLGDAAPVVLAGKPRQVPPLVAALLKLGLDAGTEFVGSPPDEVRLTHPATWTRSRITRLAEAAALAGIPTPYFIAEPVAAALATWRRGDVNVGECIAVYDLGGGTFDLAILRAVDNGFEIIGRPSGDSSIGGEMFDEVMFQLVGERLDPEAWEQIQVADEPQWMRARSILSNESRRAKETLSSHPWAEVTVALPSGYVTVRIERADFEAAISPYIEDTVLILGRCIADAALTPADLVGIQLAGGASNVPLVEQQLKQAFAGVPVRRRGDPKAAVALGAASAPSDFVHPLDQSGRDAVRPTPSAPAAPSPSAPSPSSQSPSKPSPATVVSGAGSTPPRPAAPAAPATAVNVVSLRPPPPPPAAAAPASAPTAARADEPSAVTDEVHTSSASGASGQSGIVRPPKAVKGRLGWESDDVRRHVSGALERIERGPRKLEVAEAKTHVRDVLANMSGDAVEDDGDESGSEVGSEASAASQAPEQPDSPQDPPQKKRRFRRG